MYFWALIRLSLLQRFGKIYSQIKDLILFTSTPVIDTVIASPPEAGPPLAESGVFEATKQSRGIIDVLL